jgi:Ca2+-binding RTX toxin-like protein
MQRSSAQRLVLGSLATTMLVVVAIGQPRADANHITRCFGKRPTQMNRSHDPNGSFLVGTAGSDVIIASRFADHIEGKGGRDFICALGGDDEVIGGTEDDKLSGGHGPDTIRGGGGSDLLKGGPASDTGNGGAGSDTCVSIENRSSCEIVP